MLKMCVVNHFGVLIEQLFCNTLLYKTWNNNFTKLIYFGRLQSQIIILFSLYDQKIILQEFIFLFCDKSF
jgi:hypothetical protein